VKIGRVSGTVVSTIHHRVVEGRRLLLVDLVGFDGEPTGEYVLAMDVVDSGAGETVLVLDEGNGARQVLADPEAPIRTVIVGIVDDVAVAGSE